MPRANGNSCLQEPAIEIDTNLVENAIRTTALGKKNWLFSGDAEVGERSAPLSTRSLKAVAITASKPTEENEMVAGPVVTVAAVTDLAAGNARLADSRTMSLVRDLARCGDLLLVAKVMAASRIATYGAMGMPEITTNGMVATSSTILIPWPSVFLIGDIQNVDEGTADQKAYNNSGPASMIIFAGLGDESPIALSRFPDGPTGYYDG
jgi:hypothetical protein